MLAPRDNHAFVALVTFGAEVTIMSKPSVWPKHSACIMVASRHQDGGSRL